MAEVQNDVQPEVVQPPVEDEAPAEAEISNMEEEVPVEATMETEDPVETPDKSPNKTPKKPRTPRYRRTKQYHLYTPEQKATIAKFAAEHGNTRAANRFTKELGIIVPESTIRTFKKAYYARLSEGKQPEEITEIPLRRRGRPRKDETRGAQSSPAATSAKTGAMQVANTPGFLDVSGDISLSTITDLISQVDAEKPLVVLFGTTDGALETRELTDIAIVKAFPDDCDTSRLTDQICSQMIVLVAGTQCRIDLGFLSRCPKLRIVIVFGSGSDNVELDYAGRLGIIVCNVPDYGIEEVADTTLAHILALFRQTFAFHGNVSNGTEYRTYKDIASDGKCRRIRGKTLGLIGLGKIGFAVAQRARAFGFNVCFYDPCLESGWDKAFGGLERCKALTDLVMKSDCVSLHCTLSDDSKHVVNEALLRVFKRGSYLVNISRGPLVDEKALAKALKDGWIAGAALDVHEKEPFSFKNSPLKEAPNVICTPHMAWYSKESFAELRGNGVRLVRQVLTTTDPANIQNSVNKQHIDNEACTARWNTTVE